MKLQNISDTFELIGEVADELYFVFDQKAKHFDYVGAAAKKVTGIAREQLNPKVLLDNIHPEDWEYVNESYLKLLKGETSAVFEFRMIDFEENLRYIQLKLYVIAEEKIAGTACDVTNNRTNILYAERINAKKNSSLEILTHDLKGSIGMIAMLTSAIDAGSTIENQQKIIDSIKNICNRNVDFIQSVVREEFTESAELELKKERFDAVQEIRHIVENYQHASDLIRKRLSFRNEAKHIFIVADSLKLVQVVNNLISNAIKFTPDGKEIVVEIREFQDKVWIIITDPGIGIPEELKPYIFEKYTRARREGLNGEQTVGLGMSISKKIIDLHEGAIWFESQENTGSTFYIELPKQGS